MIELAPFVACPETLGPLEAREDGVWSERAQKLYPVREGLVFLGYPQQDAAMIEATMAEEHEWQGTAETIDRDVEFLRESAPKAVALLNLASRFVTTEGDRQPRALELGSGSGWVSWLLARAGYDTWLCDFEANSLAIGLMYDDDNLGEGRRFVADARYAPFADGTFDLVLCKEFVHHVADYEGLFREANRVLRPGGTLVLMEPTRSVLLQLREWRTPDTHQGHVITWLDKYVRALGRTGFGIVHETATYDQRENRIAAMGWLKQRAARSVQDLAPVRSLFTKAHLRLVGDASNILIARKTADAPMRPRPAMTAIAPETLVISQQERAQFERFRPLLDDAAQQLRRVG